MKSQRVEEKEKKKRPFCTLNVYAITFNIIGKKGWEFEIEKKKKKKIILRHKKKTEGSEKIVQPTMILIVTIWII